jgi:hypothetical protein
MNSTTKPLLFFFVGFIILTPDSLQAQNTVERATALNQILLIPQNHLRHLLMGLTNLLNVFWLMALFSAHLRLKHYMSCFVDELILIYS